MFVFSLKHPASISCQEGLGERLRNRSCNFSSHEIFLVHCAPVASPGKTRCIFSPLWAQSFWQKQNHREHFQQLLLWLLLSTNPRINCFSPCRYPFPPKGCVCTRCRPSHLRKNLGSTSKAFLFPVLANKKLRRCRRDEHGLPMPYLVGNRSSYGTRKLIFSNTK